MEEKLSGSHDALFSTLSEACSAIISQRRTITSPTTLGPSNMSPAEVAMKSTAGKTDRMRRKNETQDSPSRPRRLGSQVTAEEVNSLSMYTTFKITSLPDFNSFHSGTIVNGIISIRLSILRMA